MFYVVEHHMKIIKTVNYLLVGSKGATGELWWSQLDAPINFSWGKNRTTVLCLKSEQTCLRSERGYQVRCVHCTVIVVGQQSNEKVRQNRWSNDKCTKETPEMTRLYVSVLLDRKKAKSERWRTASQLGGGWIATAGRVAIRRREVGPHSFTAHNNLCHD